MGSNKQTKHPKEAFISPRVTCTVGLDLEAELLTGSKVFSTPIVDTGHEAYLFETESYWE